MPGKKLGGHVIGVIHAVVERPPSKHHETIVLLKLAQLNNVTRLEVHSGMTVTHVKNMRAAVVENMSA